MTYCVGLLLESGIVMLSDTRTNAGFDNIACYRKMFVFEASGERVIAHADRRQPLGHPDGDRQAARTRSPARTPATSIMHAEHHARGRRDRRAHAQRRLRRRSTSGWRAPTSPPRPRCCSAASGCGGQLRLFLIYREGNFIEATDDTPYLQIGEHKYGKPILDRVIRPATSLEEGRKAVLISMDSTLRSNLSVGMPLDLLTIRRNEYRVGDPRAHRARRPGLRRPVRGLEQGAARRLRQPARVSPVAASPSHARKDPIPAARNALRCWRRLPCRCTADCRHRWHDIADRSQRTSVYRRRIALCATKCCAGDRFTLIFTYLINMFRDYTARDGAIARCPPRQDFSRSSSPLCIVTPFPISWTEGTALFRGPLPAPIPTPPLPKASRSVGAGMTFEYPRGRPRAQIRASPRPGRSGAATGCG